MNYAINSVFLIRSKMLNFTFNCFIARLFDCSSLTHTNFILDYLIEVIQLTLSYFWTIFETYVRFYYICIQYNVEGFFLCGSIKYIFYTYVFLAFILVIKGFFLD